SMRPWLMGKAIDLVQLLIHGQRRLCRSFDRLLPDRLKVDGNGDFENSVVPAYLAPGQIVYDIGGGKSPLLSHELKNRLGMRLVGIDISQHELDQAPEGIYDRTQCADICQYEGAGDADL